MSMRIVEAKDINRQKWSELVMNSPNCQPYNSLLFLDSLSENWCAIVLNDYSAGMALPYSIRYGVKGIYTPNFVRSLDWLGETPEQIDKIEEVIRKNFARCQLRMTTSLFHDTDPGLHYQCIEKDEAVNLNTNAKRLISRAEKEEVQIEEVALKDVEDLILTELQQKVKDLKAVDFQRYTKLLNELPASNFKAYAAKTEGNICAGVLFYEWQNRMVYLKGGGNEMAKNNGAMYALLKFGIDSAKAKNLNFDFGGSNVEGVRNFNLKFGAKDVPYYEWNWNASPWWFKFMLKWRDNLRQSH